MAERYDKKKTPNSAGVHFLVVYSLHFKLSASVLLVLLFGAFNRICTCVDRYRFAITMVGQSSRINAFRNQILNRSMCAFVREHQIVVVASSRIGV